MEWLNYHHLLYFWTVAREGGVAAASRRLRVSQSSISTQLRQLEERLGQPLFDRTHKRLQLTEAGRTAFRYADEIFGLGRELVDALRYRPEGRALRLSIGLTDTVQKLIAYRLIEPALQLPEGVQVHCEEDRLDRLLPLLAGHELDLVISDAPLPAGGLVKAFNHPLGDSKVTIFAAPALAARLQPKFPHSLDRAPFLLPAAGGALRRELERWFDRLGVRPLLVGEFDDSALLKAFGEAGVGIFCAPKAIEEEVKSHFKVKSIGSTDDVKERFFAITAERRIKHPAIVAISEAARNNLFS